jgi:hypothetical protein
VANIHYFQRYSTFENTVTNNTLQLLARIYAYSPPQAARFLSELMDGEPVDIGIEINQQERGSNSVPDGVVLQRSFKVLIESKVDAGTDVEQLIRHSESFSGEDKKLLLLLSREPIGAAEDEIKKRLASMRPDVIFKNVTFETVCKVADSLFRDYEFEMKELTNDYIAYCNEQGLFDQSRYLLRIVPCGQSFEINLKHGIYFHPSDRGYTNHQYVGIYKDKAVRALWKLDSVFDVSFRNGELAKTLLQGRDTGEYDERLKSIIADALIHCGYEIETDHRFFCGEPVETYYGKLSSGGIQGARFVNLREAIGEFADPADIARKLEGVTWE